MSSILEPGYAHDIAGAAGGSLGRAQAGEVEDLGDLGAGSLAVHVRDHVHRLSPTVAVPPRILPTRDAAHIVAPVNVGDEHVERLVRLGKGGGTWSRTVWKRGAISFTSPSPRWYIM